MIKLQSSKKYKSFCLAKNILFYGLIIPSLVALGLVLILSLFIEKSKLILASNIIFGIASFMIILLGVLLIINQVFQKKLRHEGITFFFSIVNNTKILDNPKVVYVYTTHNDMIEARILQNAQQSYENIQIWISDGSDDDKISAQYKEFAASHNFKYFKVGPKGSSTKAENLNAFLSRSGATFDYLLISDGDEYINSNFVEHALKCFSSNIKPNLGYVCPLNYCYDGDNLYNNVMLNVENSKLFGNYGGVINNFYFCNLYSSSCLISNKLLNANNGRFPDGCLEDMYLECVAIAKGYEGIILPTAVCGQQFDKGPNQFFKRVGRIHDWVIKLLKNFPYKKQGKIKQWYKMQKSGYILWPILTVLLILLSPLMATLLCVFIKIWISFIPFIILLICICIFLILLVFSTKYKAIINNSYGKFAWFFNFFHNLFNFWNSIKHLWKCLILNKYSDFVTSNKLNQQKNNSKIEWIVMLSSLFGIIIYSILHILFIGFLFAKIWTIILFFYVIVFLLIPFLISLGSIILKAASRKHVNDYDKSQFIKLPDWYNFWNDRN